MDYQVSARKYRPATFADVIGQPHVVQTLTNAITAKRIAHAFLFSGMRGVGKTTVARILAKALNCQQGPSATPCQTCPSCLEIAGGTSVDVIEIDAASNTGVDDVREIRENIKFTPFRGGYRIYIIDEVHMLSTSAFNALLKTLEEPPPHAVFIFATTEIHKIPATILSRCQHYNFRRIPRLEIMRCLRAVAGRDGITIEDRSLSALAKASEGSMRDALSLLDQAVAFGGKAVGHGDLERLLGAVPHELVMAMISAVTTGDAAAAIRVVADLVDQGHDLRAYCSDLVEHVRNLLVAVVVPSPDRLPALMDLAEDEVQRIAAEAKRLSAEQATELFRVFSQAEDGLRLTAHPRFVLEVAAVRASRLMHGGPQAQSSAGSEPAGARTGPAATAPGKAPAAQAPPAAAPGPKAKPIQIPPAPEPPAVARPPVGFDAPAARLDWDRLLHHIGGSHPQIGLFLGMGVPVNIEGDDVTIGYPESASMALDRMQKEETHRLVARACSELTGRPVRLRIVTLSEEDPALAPLKARAAQERADKQALLEGARAHPLVKQALELFGGEVIEVRQDPARKEIES